MALTCCCPITPLLACCWLITPFFHPPSPRCLPSVPPSLHAGSICSCSDTKPTLLVFAGPLAGGAIAVGLSNKCSGQQVIKASFEDIGASPSSAALHFRVMFGSEWGGSLLGHNRI